MQNDNRDSSEEMPNTFPSSIIGEYRYVIKYDLDHEFSLNDEKELRDIEQKYFYQIRNALHEGLQEFTREIDHLYDGYLRVEIGDIEQGSVLGTVLIVITGAWSVAEILIKYKDLYETLVLLKDQLRAIINKILRRNLPSRVIYKVVITYRPGPGLPAVPPASQRTSRSSSDNKFINYLIITNIILFIFLIVLVARAVISVYFKIP